MRTWLRLLNNKLFAHYKGSTSDFSRGYRAGVKEALFEVETELLKRENEGRTA